jgi:hypothetical protein
VGATCRKKDFDGLPSPILNGCHGRRVHLGLQALHPQPHLSRQHHVFLHRHGAIPPLLHPDLHNTVSSHRIRLSRGTRIKGKLFLLQEKAKGVGELCHPTRRTKPSQATSPMKKKAAAASSSPSRPAPWLPLMTRASSATTSTKNDRLRIPDGAQPQGPPQWCLSSPMVPFFFHVSPGRPVVTPRVSKPHDYANHMFMRL